MFSEPLDIVILIIGLMSSLITMIMNVPLAWKVRKSNDTRSLSKWTLLLTIGACLFWVLYSVLTIVKGVTTPEIALEQWLTAALPILVCNAFLALLMFYLFCKKTSNDKKEKLNPQNLEILENETTN